MEVDQKLNGGGISTATATVAAAGGGGGKDEDDDVPLPGFRFHPTDEELVGFYLRRKVEKRPISIELIKQIDIYKYDPWDLPKASNVGDKEWYFFCKRGRKYRNSIRPNRVTGSGFWKATGIDRPIYSAGGEGRDCIGLKKSLVYYRGSAGKGTKTDWMMHEFRLPTTTTTNTTNHNVTNNNQEAEVWTLCRIFKRNVSYRKCMPDWKELPSKKNLSNSVMKNTETCSSLESGGGHRHHHHDHSYKQSSSNYISFSSPVITRSSDYDSQASHVSHSHDDIITNQLMFTAAQLAPASSAASSYTSFPTSDDVTQFLKHGTTAHDWDELRSVVDFGGRFLL